MTVNEIITQQIIDRIEEAKRTGKTFHWVTIVEESVPNINTIIQNVLANQAQPQPDIIYLDGSYEKYKQENPDDLFPHGGWILSKD